MIAVRIPEVKEDQVLSFEEFEAQQERINWGQALLGVPRIWTQTQGKGVKVAILDTGIDTDHPDLKPAILKSKDFTSDGIEDVNGHGTHCAGMVGARNNSTGFVGIAPECELIIGKVLDNSGSGSYQQIADGVDWAVAEGADIISMSLGGPVSEDNLYRSIQKALAKGVTVICAAGNEGALLPNNIGFPGQYGGVITIAAHDRKGNPTGFSSRGGELDMMAPGEKILSTYKDGGYARLSGTSMATPFVAGLAALIISKHRQVSSSRTPIKNCEDVRYHLLRMASNPGAHNPVTGYGALMPLRYFGTGRGTLSEDMDMMPQAEKVTIVVSGSARNKLLLVDDKEVLKGNGKVSLSLSDGEHLVAWVVTGNSGDDYTIDIQEPDSAKKKITRKLKANGQDAGVVKIKI